MEEHQGDPVPASPIVKKSMTSNLLMLGILIAFCVTIGLLLMVYSLFEGVKEQALKDCREGSYNIIGSTTGIITINGTNYSMIPEGKVATKLPYGPLPDIKR